MITYAVGTVSTESSRRTTAKRVTIADVAREAGVSRTTVSHSLNDIGQVDPRTRQRVKEVAARLHFRPSVRAQRLRAGRSQTIALLSSMPPAVSGGVSRLGFFTDLAMGCAEVALLRGYVLALAPPVQGQDSLAHLDIDGAILLEPAPSDWLATELTDRGVPFVRIDGPDDASSVDLHHREAADILLGHLIEQGATAIGLVCGSSGRTAQRTFRERYLAAAQQHGLPVAIAEADERAGERSGYAATTSLLTDHPGIDALCISIDAFATGAVQAAHDLGRVIGTDLLLATRYDGIRARTSNPPLTALDLHLEEVAHAAVELLLRRLGDIPGEDRPVPSTPAPTLVVRASTQRTPAGN
ncbi:LacI family DNA-binding transcriptional regulator [Flexivirga oryzae]|uniref:DNA-binding LacI/PurR family transcriptional regulator n=1 Tax=Flexivirga oryzae TaxID=1794944 RepID=A0A839N6Q1_9MICO|nr:DNA-binding LacI/PurR family transcriptional regulator [Flexivirga oryzae]